MNGGVPATIGVLNGVARVGLEANELVELTASAGQPETCKVSRRDLGYVCGLVRTSVEEFVRKDAGSCFITRV